MGDLQPSHVGLCVSDLKASMRFYCDGLGFEVSDGYDLDSTTVLGLDAALEVPGPAVLRSQMIVLDGLKIELLHYTSPTVDGTPSARRNQRLLACGGTLLPATRQSPGVDLVFVADPDGTRVELMQRPATPAPPM